MELDANISAEPITIYETENVIKGVAIHVKQQLLFVSESSGNVLKMTLSNNTNKNAQAILSASSISFTPLDLSIDWLNNHLYILGELNHRRSTVWQIARCGLDGSDVTVAVAGLRRKPYNIEVDPYNG